MATITFCSFRENEKGVEEPQVRRHTVLDETDPAPCECSVFNCGQFDVMCRDESVALISYSVSFRKVKKDPELRQHSALDETEDPAPCLCSLFNGEHLVEISEKLQEVLVLRRKSLCGHAKRRQNC